jgi:hypothetical protein
MSRREHWGQFEETGPKLSSDITYVPLSSIWLGGRLMQSDKLMDNKTKKAILENGSGAVAGVGCGPELLWR